MRCVGERGWQWGVERRELRGARDVKIMARFVRGRRMTRGGCVLVPQTTERSEVVRGASIRRESLIDYTSRVNSRLL
jgi:hypothetical protein